MQQWSASRQVTLGWRLQMALANGGLKAQEMADHLGVSRSTVSRWMNDHGAPPRRPDLIQWAMRCGVDVEWLSTGHASTTGGGNGGALAPATEDPAFQPLGSPVSKLIQWRTAA